MSTDRREFIKRGIGALSTLAVGEIILLTPGEASAVKNFWGSHLERPNAHKKGLKRVVNDYSRATKIKSVCLNCSTVCGIEGFVIDNKVVKVRGNPEDPNVGNFMACAKGQSGPTINDYPERVLYPLKRVGKRGEGLWKRITWDEAYDEIAKRIQTCIDDKVPEQVAFQQGRSRIGAETSHFMNAIGSGTILNHRALCSLNKRAANYISLGETDWESVDAENCKYFLNFGSNFYEAHQGGFHLLKRVIKARYDHGAKLVTFDVRLSNTAGRSDDWFAPFPGTEGAIALGMANVIMNAGQYDKEFLEKWTNFGPEKLLAWLKPYTPEWAAKLSGLDAKDISRVALEFAAQRPAVAAFTNRGSMAHYNGLNNDRAVIMLNAIVGSIGRVGGYCYGELEKLDNAIFPPPEPQPPAAKTRTDLEDPPEWPIANRWQKMKVGQMVYDYMKRGRGKVQVYLSYTVSSPMTWPEGRSLAVEVLSDEKLIPFHACSDVVYSEMAHYADLILPDATYLERWGLDIRNNLELRPYVTLRQAMVKPAGEAKSFADSMFDIGRRLSPEVAKYFQFGNHVDFVKSQCANIPKGDSASGFEYMQKHGVYTDMTLPKGYEIFMKPIKPIQLESAHVDEKTQVIYRTGKDGKEKAVGVMVDGVARRGFATPSRKFEIHCPEVTKLSAKVGLEVDGLPSYIPIPSHENLPSERFILTTFKWNVHTQARTATQKYLSEIVHDNPMWINAGVAKKLGLKTGDWVEVTTFRPKGHTYEATGEMLGSAKIPVFVTEGIHPRVLAVSNSVGYFVAGRAATGKQALRDDFPGYGPVPQNDDLSWRVWWDSARGGRGNGYNINAVLPIQPAPVSGMQAWYDTVCEIRKVDKPEARA